MEAAAKLVSALAALAWPVVAAILLFKLLAPIRALVDSARARKFTLKVAGNELTMEEVSEQQRVIVSDLQRKVAEIEKSIQLDPNSQAARFVQPSSAAPVKRLLWVDDNPRNNSLLAATLEERGLRVDIALSTDEGLAKFRRQPYDLVLSDMGRPEGEKAGIDLTRKIKSLSPGTPVFIYCGSWAARNWREEALQAGATEITASASSLFAALPLTEA